MIGDNIRETEASRLKTRGSMKTQQSPELYQPASPIKQQPAAHLQGTELPTLQLSPFCEKQAFNSTVQHHGELLSYLLLAAF